jgi:glycosyltransferase involved in cell wall biosynthesis
MKISACLIVKNEADNIGKCLNSLKDISNEIIVVDTGSTDNTVEIAQSYGAKVYYYQWDENFSNAKNYALDRATGDWIIFLDADEYFEANTQKHLHSALKHISPNKKIDAILCKIINIEVKTGRAISENPTIRIFRGKSGIRYDGAIHEQPLKYGKTLISANITDVSFVIYHTGYSITIMPEKVHRNLRILESEIEKNNITNLTYYYMSSSHYVLGNYEEAIKYGHLSLEHPELKNTIMAYLPYVIIVKSMLQLKDKYAFEEIEKLVDEALALYPTHPEIWFVRGLSKIAQNDIFGTIESYRKALEYNENYKLLLNNGFPANTEFVIFELGRLCSSVGDNVNALDYFFEVLRINKFNFGALARLYEIIKDQPSSDIILFLNSIYNKENKDDLHFLNGAMGKLGNTVLANYYYKQYEK